jgi:hypothetical protein
MSVRGVVADVEGLEHEAAVQPRPGVDVVMLTVPMPTYRALSDAAARKNLTVAQLLTRAFTLAIEEV